MIRAKQCPLIDKEYAYYKQTLKTPLGLVRNLQTSISSGPGVRERTRAHRPERIDDGVSAIELNREWLEQIITSNIQPRIASVDHQSAIGAENGPYGSGSRGAILGGCRPSTEISEKDLAIMGD